MKENAFLRVTIDVVQEARLALLDFLMEVSPGGVVEESEWEGVHVSAHVYLPRDRSEEKLDLIAGYLDSLRELWGIDSVLLYDVSEVVDSGWTTEYQRYFTAQRVTSRITVAPPWEEYVGKEGEIVISILPGPAFGTGTHETTRLCLRAMEDVCANAEIASMLDVGCGSAILSIAGAFLGIERIIGIESDPDAVPSARDNVARNGLDKRITIRNETFTRPVGEFDLVVANLTTKEIKPVIGPLFQSVRSGGRLVLSGILDTEEEEMVEAVNGISPSHPPAVSVRGQGEWRCFVIVTPRD